VGITNDLVELGMSLRAEAIPERAKAVARHCVLDWFGCAIAGAREPLSEILVREIAAGERSEATLAGRCERTSALNAALINGAMSHALDFDDTHTLMSGHPSVPVMPAALALAERDDRDGAAFLAAVIAGIETECRLGAVMNPHHYALGFHATGTLGTFGAAAACAHLLGLDGTAWAHALALAGTQASGLKSGFGTMAKPLHAGRAAHNGLFSALAARGGYEGNAAVVEAAQGFALTHGVPEPDVERLGAYDGQFLICDTLFKYHASCYLTHAPIEAALKLRAQGLQASDISAVEVRASTGCIGVCDIAKPRSGLEGKFSLRATVAMTLLGDDTTDPASFSDERMQARDLREMRDRITFTPMAALLPTQATVIVHASGNQLVAEADTGKPSEDLDRQWDALSAKFFGLASPVIGKDRAARLQAAVANIKSTSSMREIVALARPEGDQ
jgi:2-methylcitrate dehydratase PrpD